MLERAEPRPSFPYPVLDPRLLKNEPFLMVHKQQRIRQITDSVLKKAGIGQPHIRLTLRSYENIRILASQGLGVTLLPSEYETPALCIFSALFFLVVLYFSLRPSGILTWVGKVLNPLFLLFLSILLAAALLQPMGDPAALEPIGSYAGQSAAQSFFLGFLEGYNTLDALAALAFGIVLINAIRGLGVQSPQAISGSTVKAGCLSTALMAVIYCLLTVVGAQSRAVYGLSTDGGEALYQIGTHYFGTLGGVLLGVTVTFACLQTAIGLITSELMPLADLITPEELSADYIIPKAFDKRVGPAVAKAVAEAARKSGVARI